MYCTGIHLITEDEARLFINSRKFSPELRAYFEENHVAIEKYDAIYDAVAGSETRRSS